jgi:hypothetical protein
MDTGVRRAPSIMMLATSRTKDAAFDEGMMRAWHLMSLAMRSPQP